MNLDFFSTNSLLEQEYILKYFYLLDPQAIATEVHAELEQKGIVELDIDSENIELFFHTLFHHVYTHAYQYVKFIPTNGFKDSFFGEPADDNKEKYKDLYPFSYISQDKAGLSKDPAEIELYNFQYKRAQEIFRLFHE